VGAGVCLKCSPHGKEMIEQRRASTPRDPVYEPGALPLSHVASGYPWDVSCLFHTLRGFKTRRLRERGPEYCLEEEKNCKQSRVIVTTGVDPVASRVSDGCTNRCATLPVYIPNCWHPLWTQVVQGLAITRLARRFILGFSCLMLARVLEQFAAMKRKPVELGFG
jgi:hypothetical protein